MSLFDTTLDSQAHGKRAMLLAAPSQGLLPSHSPNAGMAREPARPALSLALALALHLMIAAWWQGQAQTPVAPPPPIEVSLMVSKPVEQPQSTAPAAPEEKAQTVTPAPSPPPIPEKPPEKPAPEKKVSPKPVTPKKPKPAPAPKPLPKREFEPDSLDRPVRPSTIDREPPAPSRRMPPSLTAPARPAPPAPPRAASTGLAPASAQPIFVPSPAYSPVARRRGLSGTVTVRIRISDRGTVQDVSIAKSSGYDILDKDALNAARQIRFQPLKPGQKRTSDVATVPIKFRISGDEDEEAE